MRNIFYRKEVCTNVTTGSSIFRTFHIQGLFLSLLYLGILTNKINKNDSHHTKLKINIVTKVFKHVLKKLNKNKTTCCQRPSWSISSLTFRRPKQDEIHGFDRDLLSMNGILNFQDIPSEVVVLNGNAETIVCNISLLQVVVKSQLLYKKQSCNKYFQI